VRTRAGRPVGHGRLYGAVRQQCRPGQPIRVRRVAAWPLTGGPHMSAIFQFQKTSQITFSHKKNRYKVRKILIKFMEVGNPIWNTFHDYNFFCAIHFSVFGLLWKPFFVVPNA
jgi:hypothetical protein